MRNLKIARKKLDELCDELNRKEIYYRTFVAKLNKKFKSLKVRFSIKNDSKVGEGQLIYLGFFNGEIMDQQDDGCLYSVDILKNKKDDWLRPTRKETFLGIFLVLAHEMRHGHQYRSRRYKTKIRRNPTIIHFNKHIQKQVNYLIDYDEIDAYAYAAAVELCMKGWNIKRGLTKLWITRTLYDKFVKKYAPIKHWRSYVKKVYNYYNKINKEHIRGSK